MMPARRKKGELEAAILAAVKRGPLPILTMSILLNSGQSALRTTVRRMVEHGVLDDYGRTADLGFDVLGRDRRSRVFGLARELPDEDIADKRPAPRAARARGVITPRPYATGFRWGNAAW